MHHVQLIHADQPNFKIDCTFQRCCRSFKNYHTYRNHIYAFHSTSSGDLDLQTSEAICTNVSDPQDTDDNSEMNADEDLDYVQSSEVSSIQHSAAVWTLKVRDGHGLPQSTTENIMKDVDSLYQVTKSYTYMYYSF